MHQTQNVEHPEDFIRTATQEISENIGKKPWKTQQASKRHVMSAAIRLHLLWGTWCHQTGKWVWERKPPEDSRLFGCQTLLWSDGPQSLGHPISFPKMKKNKKYIFHGFVLKCTGCPKFPIFFLILFYFYYFWFCNTKKCIGGPKCPILFYFFSFIIFF